MVNNGYLTRTLATVLDPALLIEKDALEILNSFDMKTILFTACVSGKVGPVESVKQVKYEGLKRLGIDFDHTFKQDLENPVFYKGILFSQNDDRKGAVLVDFLKKMKFTAFKTIVLVDDQQNNLKDVRNALHEHFSEIKFVGVHYQGAFMKGGDISAEEFKAFWVRTSSLANEESS